MPLFAVLKKLDFKKNTVSEQLYQKYISKDALVKSVGYFFWVSLFCVMIHPNMHHYIYSMQERDIQGDILLVQHCPFIMQ